MPPSPIRPEPPKLTWHVAPVSEDEERIELIYGDPKDKNWSAWPVVARLSKPEGDSFRVEWLVDTDTEPEIVSEVTRDINYLMIELEDPDPWNYACFHCTTTSNLYSMVHWAHIKPGTGER